MAYLARVAVVIAALLVLACCTSGSESGEWVRVADAPFAGRYSAAFVELPDGALVIGGSDDAYCSPSADCLRKSDPLLRDGARYHAVDESWTSIADAPVEITTFAPYAVLDQRVFFWVDGAAKTSVETGELIAYDLAANRWESYEDPPVKPFAAIDITAFGSRLLAGQQTNETWRGGDWLLDPTTGLWELLPADPLGVSLSRTFVADRTQLYLFETPRDSEEPVVRTTAVFDATTAKWKRLADNSEQLWDPVGVVGEVLVQPHLGSADGGSVNSSGRLYPYGGIYDPSFDEWTGLPNSPSGEYESSAVVVGASDQVVNHYRGEWILNWETETWHAMPSLDDLRASRDDRWVEFAAFGWAGDGLLVVGGGVWEDPNTGDLRNDAWIWRPGPAERATNGS